MYRTIVVGWDGSERGRDALALAGLLRAAEPSVTAACVYPDPGPGRARAGERAMLEMATEVAAEARRDWQGGGLETRGVPGHSPAHGLQRLCEREGADLVVIGSSHRGRVGRVLAGSVGQRLLNGSPCPVAVAPSGFGQRPRALRKVAVAYDGSDESAVALREAASLSSTLGAGLEVVTVITPVEVWAGGERHVALPPDEEFERVRREAFAKKQAEALAALPGRPRAELTLLDGSASARLVDWARTGGIDLLLAGSRNYGPLRHVLLGSTAIELIRRCPCPMIVIPRGAAASAAGQAGAEAEVVAAPAAARGTSAAR